MHFKEKRESPGLEEKQRMPNGDLVAEVHLDNQVFGRPVEQSSPQLLVINAFWRSDLMPDHGGTRKRHQFACRPS